MNTRLSDLLAVSLLGTWLLAACSPQSRPFLLQVAGTDRVVVSDWVIGARLVLTGPDALALSRSILLAEGPPMALHLGTSCSAEFYRGTNLLARIRCEAGYFTTNSPKFFVHDESGALFALQRRLEHDKSTHANWVHALVQAAREARLGDLQRWREQILEAEQTKNAIAQASERGEQLMPIHVPFSKPPSEFVALAKALWIPAPSVSVSVDRFRRTDLVLVSWANQYGFFVGPTNGYIAVFHAEQITNFAPGVCAFHRGNYGTW